MKPAEGGQLCTGDYLLRIVHNVHCADNALIWGSGRVQHVVLSVQSLQCADAHIMFCDAE